MKCHDCFGEGRIIKWQDMGIKRIGRCDRCNGSGRLCDECQNPTGKKPPRNHLDICTACTERIMKSEGGR